MSVTPQAPPDPPRHSASGRARLEQVFTTCQAQLLGTLYCLLGNVEDTRDALQEAFLKCWRHAAELDGVENLKAWVFRVVVNTGRDLRQNAWRRKRRALPEEDAMASSPSSQPCAQIEADERIARLREAVARLRPEEQEVFLLRQNGELTYEEIAAQLGIPTGTAKTRMRCALAHLRSVLQEL
jgi:RNA polymerase sigma-70 factor (ECF subfamily)